MKGTLRICKKGHSYYKSSDCPTCPQCAQNNKPSSGLLSLLYAPARRALLNAGISSEEELAIWSEEKISALHGMGPASLPILRKALKAKGLQFNKEKLSIPLLRTN